MNEIILDSIHVASGDRSRPLDDARDAHTTLSGTRGGSPSASSPETPGQARIWIIVRNNYTRFGLCFGCAAQAAWGHQNGFLTVKPPCEACIEAVALLPKPGGASSPWRRFRRGSVGY